ncbi:MAG: DUF6455 family protein [Kiloniellaceae bacterium]
MATSFIELARMGLALAVLAGLVWTVYRLLDRYPTEGGLARIGRMMKRVGIDVRLARRPELGEDLCCAAARCMRCPHPERCRRWLAAGAGEDPPDFCLNAAWLGTLKRRSQAGEL